VASGPISVEVTLADLSVNGKSTIFLRSNRGGVGDKCARFSLLFQTTIKVIKFRRMMVKLAWCGVQSLEKRQHGYYHCGKNGHIAATCKGPDRGRGCFRCKAKGHFVRNSSGLGKNVVHQSIPGQPTKIRRNWRWRRRQRRQCWRKRKKIQSKSPKKRTPSKIVTDEEESYYILRSYPFFIFLKLRI